ncbi:TRAP transporter substrate-binding protein DctP [Acidimangrovimonas pyrenivorans]|uniref:TRAP transporter substrate-binding protein DctP n=1 Tax=Acidimangrovimonas pyrenivorans TaxID=2030798 RepID=A0ABV7AF51_9RHOB
MTINLKSFVAAAAIALIGTSSWAAEYTMRLSHQFPPSHPSAKRLEQFAKDVAKDTDGKVEVQLFGGAQLYNPKQHLAAVASGEIESAVILNLQWGGTLPEMSVALIPYLISSPKDQKAFIASDAAKFLDEKMLKKGVKNIAWMVDTNDLIFTSNGHPLEKPSDFKGVKIRGLTPIFDAGLKAMGATTVVMPGSETYQALQTGVVDAGVTGVAAAYSRKFYEVQKYGRATPIFVAFDNLVVNPAWFNGLPADVQKGIEKAAATAVADSITPTDSVDPKKIDNLTGVGMDARVLTPDETAALKAAMQPAVEAAFVEKAGDEGKKLLDLVGKM